MCEHTEENGCAVLCFFHSERTVTLSEVRVVIIKFGLHGTQNPTLRTHTSLWNRTPACPEGESQLVFSKPGLRFVRLEAFTGRTGTVFTLWETLTIKLSTSFYLEWNR